MNNCNSMILKSISPAIIKKDWSFGGTTFRVDYVLEARCHEKMESEHDQGFDTLEQAKMFQTLLKYYIGLEFDYSDWKTTAIKAGLKLSY